MPVCGVGNDFYPGQQIDYVLSGWTGEQEKVLPERIELAGEIIKSFGSSDFNGL